MDYLDYEKSLKLKELGLPQDIFDGDGFFYLGEPHECYTPSAYNCFDNNWNGKDPKRGLERCEYVKAPCVGDILEWLSTVRPDAKFNVQWNTREGGEWGATGLVSPGCSYSMKGAQSPPLAAYSLAVHIVREKPKPKDVPMISIEMAKDQVRSTYDFLLKSRSACGLEPFPVSIADIICVGLDNLARGIQGETEEEMGGEVDRWNR